MFTVWYSHGTWSVVASIPCENDITALPQIGVACFHLVIKIKSFCLATRQSSNHFLLHLISHPRYNWLTCPTFWYLFPRKRWQLEVFKHTYLVVFPLQQHLLARVLRLGPGVRRWSSRDSMFHPDQERIGLSLCVVLNTHLVLSSYRYGVQFQLVAPNRWCLILHPRPTTPDSRHQQVPQASDYRRRHSCQRAQSRISPAGSRDTRDWWHRRR